MLYGFPLFIHRASSIEILSLHIGICFAVRIKSVGFLDFGFWDFRFWDFRFWDYMWGLHIFLGQKVKIDIIF